MGKRVKVMLEDEAAFVCCQRLREDGAEGPQEDAGRAEEFKIRAVLAQLDPADRKLAEEQKFCAVSPESRLGSMDKPVKITLKHQPVFVLQGMREDGTQGCR